MVSGTANILSQFIGDQITMNYFIGGSPALFILDRWPEYKNMSHLLKFEMIIVIRWDIWSSLLVLNEMCSMLGRKGENVIWLVDKIECIRGYYLFLSPVSVFFCLFFLYSSKLLAVLNITLPIFFIAKSRHES